jgi:hypothetical protein
MMSIIDFYQSWNLIKLCTCLGRLEEEEGNLLIVLTLPDVIVLGLS